MSPARTTTAPLACLASLPVSKEISLAADLHRDAGHVKHAHVFAFPFGRPVGGPSASELSFSNARDVTEPLALRPQRARRARRRARCPSTNAVGVPVTPARIPLSKSRRTRSATALGAAVGARSARGRARARSRPLPQVRVVDVRRGRRRASRPSPRSAPCSAAASAAACSAGARGCFDWRPGSGGSTSRSGSAAISRPGARRSAGSRGRRRRSTSGPSPRTWSSGPSGGTAALVSSAASAGSAAAASSASKIRLAPGISSGVGDCVAPSARRRRASISTSERLAWPPLVEVGAVGARDLALGVEVGEQRRSSRPSCSRNALWRPGASRR